MSEPSRSRPMFFRPDPAKGGSRARAVGSFVPKLTSKVLEKYGFSAATLLTDWATVVGADLAAYTQPERLKWPRAVEAFGDTPEGGQGRPGATLVLRVDGARALDVQYRGRQIIERINAYFGYRAVAELRIVQAPIARAPGRKAPVSSTRAAIAPLSEIADVTSDPLRQALERLHHAVIERSRASNR